MADRQQQCLKQHVNAMLFMLSRQEFHTHQIESERRRLRKSIDRSAPGKRKLQHLTLIREYQMLLAESSWYLQKQLNKLQKYMDLHPKLKKLEIYQQADNVLKEMRIAN